MKHLITILLATAITTAQQTSSSLIECLDNINQGGGDDGPIAIDQTDGEYQDSKHSFNLRYDYDPTAIFYPSTEEHVQQAVRCARQYNVKVAPRGGGHSYEGYSQGGQDGSLIIDLQDMDSVTVNAEDATATVGPGNRLGRLYVELWDAGEWAFPGGSCPSVGVAGFLLGGGFGFLTSQYGGGADNIIEMRMVDSTGEILTINAQSNQDLFWALRGAGHANFGIVTSFTLRIYQLETDTVTHCYMEFPTSQSNAVLSTYSSWARTIPSHLSTGASYSSGSIVVYGLCLDTRRNCRELFRPLLEQIGVAPRTGPLYQARNLINAHLLFSDYAVEDYRGLADLSNDRADRYWQSSDLMYNEPLTESTIAIMDQYVATGLVSVDLDYFGGENSRLSNTPVDTNAFIHRSSLFTLQLWSSWGDFTATAPGRGDCEECITAHREFLNALINNHRELYPDQPLRSYQNYPDAEFPDWQEAYYGSGFDRLVQVKSTHDPTDLFNFPMSFPVDNSTVTTSRTATSGSSSSSNANTLKFSSSSSWNGELIPFVLSILLITII